MYRGSILNMDTRTWTSKWKDRIKTDDVQTSNIVLSDSNKCDQEPDIKSKKRYKRSVHALAKERAVAKSTGSAQLVRLQSRLMETRIVLRNTNCEGLRKVIMKKVANILVITCVVSSNEELFRKHCETNA